MTEIIECMPMARRQAEFKRDTQRLETDYGGKHEGGNRANTLHLQWQFMCHDLG